MSKSNWNDSDLREFQRENGEKEEGGKSITRNEHQARDDEQRSGDNNDRASSKGSEHVPYDKAFNDRAEERGTDFTVREAAKYVDNSGSGK